MATLNDLAVRTLQKLQVLGQDETAAPADLVLATDKLRSVHAELQAEGLLRWTLATIPAYAEEAYLLMAAYLAAPDFQAQRDPEGWAVGLAKIQRAVHLPNMGPTYADYF